MYSRSKINLFLLESAFFTVKYSEISGRVEVALSKSSTIHICIAKVSITLHKNLPAVSVVLSLTNRFHVAVRLSSNRSQMTSKCVKNLTNRFHVAVRLFSNRSQMTSKCGKNKKVAHEAIAECVTDVLTTF